jgi:uncharacterized protein (DUF3084 family)
MIAVAADTVQGATPPDDDSINTRSAMRLMGEEMKKINGRMDAVVTTSTLTQQLDKKLEETSRDIMGKVHQVVNTSTNAINTKLATLESAQDLIQKTMTSKIESEVKRQLLVSDKNTQALRSDFNFMSAQQETLGHLSCFCH